MLESITPPLAVGAEYPGPERVVSAARIRAFSGGPLDSSEWPAKNLHTDVGKANEAGLHAPIASGIQYESHLVELLYSLFGEAWFQHGSLMVKYPRPVFAGDVVQPFARVTALTQAAGVSCVELDVWSMRGNEEKVLVGTASCRIAERSA